MDEIHMIGKKEGCSMEIISKIFNKVNFLALSATIGNIDEITSWFRKLNTDRRVENIICDKRFFNLQRFYYNSKDNRLETLNPLALVNINDFINGDIIKKNLQPTPTDTWILYSKLKEVFSDLSNLNHTNYFEPREIVHLDKVNKYFLDLINFMIMKAKDASNLDKIKNIINSFKNIELNDEIVDLVKLAFKLKEEKKNPAIIFQKNTLACLRMVRKFAKTVETMEDTEFSDLLKNRIKKMKKVKDVAKKNTEHETTKTTCDKNGNVINTKVKCKKEPKLNAVKKDKGKQYEKSEGTVKIDPRVNDNDNFDVADVEGLYQPTDKYNFNDIQYFSEERIEELVDQLKLWFPYNGGQYHFIIRLLWRGVGVYAKGLPDPYLRLVQKLTSEKKLAILFSDMSLVFGVSMPFRTAVIYKDSYVEDDLDAMLYHQMAGRAGRRGLDKEGNVVFAGYKWNRIEELSICPIPNIIGTNTLNFVIPHANKISELKGNNLNWENVFKNPLDNKPEEDQIEMLESIKSNYSPEGGWNFAFNEDINHLLMMWSLRNSDDSEPIIISYLLPFIKRGFESMEPDSHINQIEIALFLANFISTKETKSEENKLIKNSLFETPSFANIFNDLENLEIEIPKNIDNSIWNSIKMNKLEKTSTEKEADELRERLLNFAQKIMSIQHYYFETKSGNLAKLLAKLLTRIWWIYHTSSPLMKPFGYYDDEGEYEEVDNVHHEEEDEEEDLSESEEDDSSESDDEDT